MLIAVASKDGKEINQHFGHAERFLIYDVEESEAKLVDEKKVERYCSFNPDNPLRGHALREIADALQGCRAVVTAQMGEHPQGELEKLGITPFAVSGPIKATLVELAKIL
ncbi:NifB/NifX family molybdenum-iron cluster-binding protein [Geobacter sp. AOG2]|uniref:NifB/NifX family molybdenum-iron cluster-binding protein n=1 Tax=Geobacter sp. AOG2 TaxID=1566347 RepID=UPI001CC43C04|nr:NifB/NifX family molybdenum-iron cluster-binding protein [Geobacter sp. AOG2]GFE59693.1 dinitrogenase iron-molybdenum cofactor biosynthesis protein [Geobacter sp. AOG2]